MRDTLTHCTCGCKLSVIESRQLVIGGVHTVWRRKTCKEHGGRPTDEELDALVRELMNRPYRRGGESNDEAAMRRHGEREQAAAAIIALRAQLAEVLAERAFTVSDGQRMLRKQDILTVCDAPDLCFEHDNSVARCGPCATKLAERAGIALNQYTVSNPEAMRLRRELAAANARADRAEAALAAQPHDPAKVQALVEALEYALRVAEHLCSDRFQPVEDVHMMVLSDAKIASLSDARAVLAAWKEPTNE